MKNIKVFIPYKGGSVYGYGEVILNLSKSVYKYSFVSDSGVILFNSVNDTQVKGIMKVTPLEDSDLKFDEYGK